MGELFKAGWDFLATPITLPWIGTNSILMLGIYLALLELLVSFINSLLEQDD